MRVTAKLAIAFVLGVCVVMGVSTWLAIAHETRQFERLAAEDAKQIGQALEGFVVTAWHTDGYQGVLQLLQKPHPSEQGLRISWVWFDAPAGPHSPMASIDKIRPVHIERTQAIIAEKSGRKHLCHYWRVNVPSERPGGLEFAKPMGELADVKRDEILQAVTWISLSVLAGGLLMAVVGLRFVGRPLRQIMQQTRDIAAGNLDTRIELHSNDELGQLAQSFNAMCSELKASQAQAAAEAAARLSATEQLRHADRLKTVGRLASGVAHELGTPLNVVAGRAQLIASGKLTEDEVLSSAKTIERQANRMTTIIRQLLDFARRRTPQRSSVDVRNVVDHTAKLLEPLASKSTTTITVTADDSGCFARIDAGQIEQVLTNLFVNAIQSMPGGGQVHVEVMRRQAKHPDQPDALPANYVCVAVRDEGHGIAEENLAHVFEPFFTTKSFGEGTGLGLSISYGIVQEHGGFIEVQSKPGEGSCFTVFLPGGDSE